MHAPDHTADFAPLMLALYDYGEASQGDHADVNGDKLDWLLEQHDDHLERLYTEGVILAAGHCPGSVTHAVALVRASRTTIRRGDSWTTPAVTSEALRLTLVYWELGQPVI